jgi:hypothetical protein
MNSLIPLQKIGMDVGHCVSNSTSPHDEMEDKAVALIHAQFVGVRVRAKMRFYFILAKTFIFMRSTKFI